MVDSLGTREAKEFFTRKITARADEEHVLLSRAERYMLQWSEGDQGLQADKALTEAFEKSVSMAEYERKIAKLIAHAYRHDVEHNSRAKEEYRRAYRALKLEDNYLFVIVDRAVGRHLNRVRLFFGMYESGREYLLKAILYGLLSAFLMCGGLLSLAGTAWAPDELKELLPQFVIGAVFLLLALSNITRYRNYKKEHSDYDIAPGKKSQA